MPQYQGVWSLQQQMQALTSGQWATDPLFDYTTLLLQADNAANSAQNNTFLDSSTNAFAITRNGNTTQGSFSPFSATGWGNYFVEANNDYLTTNSSASFGISGDFTYEGWVYLTSTAFKRFIMPSSVSMNVDISQVSSGNMRLVFFDGTTVFNDDINTFPINTWVHVAVVRSGSASNNCAFYVNGVRGTRFTSNATNSTVSITIGKYSTNGFDGYISNLRFCKSAVYSGSSFAPPTSPLTTTSQGATNCVLLTCQSNRFVDNSSTAATITPTGTPSVQPFSPFAPQYQWTSDVIGGSGYFDGSGDYLSAGSNTAFSFGTGAYTVEVWLYPTTIDAIDIYVATDSTNGFQMYQDGGRMRIGQSGVGMVVETAAGVLTANAWNHIVVCRASTSANQASIFINGSRKANGTDATNWSVTGPLVVSHATYPVNGYMTSVRVVKGTDVYGYNNTSITVPTAPLTAITNTSLLLNFTNAGIYDGTMKNNLETVGNAQVSTSVVKYGSGSMYNPGTTGSYLTRSVSSQLFVFPGDFTIEFWAWKSASGANAYDTPVSCDSDGNATNGWALELGTVRYMFFTVNTGAFTLTSPAINVNDATWHHYAVCRANGIVRMFRDGVLLTSGTYSATIGNASIPALKVFAYGNATTNSFNGYMDDLRISQFARYTQNFIPPSVALPRQ